MRRSQLRGIVDLRTFWPSLLLVLPLAAQVERDPARLVGQLRVAEERASARAALVAQGSAAVPALLDLLPDVEGDEADRLLGILEEIGPAAGSAVPELLAAVDRAATTWGSRLLWTLSELGPYRSPGVELDGARLGIQVHMARLQKRVVGGGDDAVPLGRLDSRLSIPIDAAVAALRHIVRGHSAWRIELAVELLGRRGADAAAALPELRQVLDRPDPRVLTTERTVPLRAKAARAILAIAPMGEHAGAARAVLAGAKAPAPPPVPPRVLARIDKLATELRVDATCQAAADNLVALGEPAAATLVAAAKNEPGDVRTVALRALRGLGQRAAAVVPDLLDLLFEVEAEDAVAIVEVLTAAAPWCRDVMPYFSYGGSVGSLEVMGHRLPGAPGVADLNAFWAAAAELIVALDIDPTCSWSELARLLEHRDVLHRERALELLAARDADARPLLPVLAGMLDARHPPRHVHTWVDARSSRSELRDCSPRVHWLVARAILAIASRDDPLVPRAEEIVAAGPEARGR